VGKKRAPRVSFLLWAKVHHILWKLLKTS